MKTRKILVWMLTVLFLLPAVLPATLGEAQAAAPETQADEPYTIEYVYTRDLISAYYHLYGSVLDDFVEVYITNNTDTAATFLVETEIEGYSSISSDTVAAEPGEKLEIRQNPRLVPESLEKLNSQRYANFTIRVTHLKEGEDDLLKSETQEILLYSRRDYSWVSGFDHQGNIDLLAAFITPNDPGVEELLRKAADYTSSGQIWAGYGGHVLDDSGGVWERLYAIWQAEKEYQLTYVSTWVSFTPESSQRMRLPFETLEQSGGNCIELVFLYASAVEALDLECAIVLVPGHAYLGVRMDQENAQYYFIETTMIGQSDFSDAVAYAGSSWEEDIRSLDAGDEDYGWVKVWDAREAGILPVPWR